MSLEVKLSNDITLAFNVPLLIQQMPGAEATNERLRRVILSREDREQGAAISNRGGWHSAGNILDWPEPEIAILRAWIDSAVQQICRAPIRRNPEALDLEYRASGWANVNRNGDYNAMHSHPGSHWAVVYYVAVGNEEPGHVNNGQLELRDPRPAAEFGKLPGFMFGRGINLQPRPGLLVVFPAWIEHWVHPFYGTGERISVAVNIDVLRYRVPRPDPADASMSAASRQ